MDAGCLPEGSGKSLSLNGPCKESFILSPLAARVRMFLWLRVGVATLLFGLYATTGTGWVTEEGVGAVLLLLGGALVLTGLSALGLRARVPASLLGGLQVAWDLCFSAAWIYATGGTDSLFLFLFLFVIIEASFLLEPPGAVLTAFLCALCYWVAVHLEYHGILAPLAERLASPEPRSTGGYPVAGFIFILAAFGSTAWLSNNLKDRLSRTRRLLQERTADVKDLLSLNESIVRCVRSGIVTLDRENRVTSINEAAAVITGYGPEEIVGARLEDFLGPVPDEALQGIGALSPHPSRWEQTFRGKGNQVLCLGCSGAVLRDHNGQSFGHLIIFQDLSPYKEIEQALQRAERLAAIGELAAGLAHEIRNPLASLYGSIQLLQGDLVLQGSHERLMRIILQESERLNRLITDFLRFASSQADAKSRVVLRALVGDVLALFRTGPHLDPATRVSVDVAGGLSVLGDEKQIRQILWNLLLNAAQATEGGRIRIAARESRDAYGRPAVSITVDDTGRGIPKENLRKIFDPFYTSRPEGTGLGLAVVYRMVENHNGEIHVESTEGEGSSFRIDLPHPEVLPAECAGLGIRVPG